MSGRGCIWQAHEYAALYMYICATRSYYDTFALGTQVGIATTIKSTIPEYQIRLFSYSRKAQAKYIIITAELRRYSVHISTPLNGVEMFKNLFSL